MEEKYFKHLNCPNCGASMTFYSDYAWECEHCGSKFYVMPAKKVDMVCTLKVVEEDFLDNLSEEEKNDFHEYMDKDVAEGIGNYLLNKGYIEKNKMKNVIPDKTIIYEYVLGVVSFKEEQEDKNSL